MRQLQYGKLCELVETLQEAAVIFMNKILKKAAAAVMIFSLTLGGVVLNPIPDVQAKAKKVSIAKSADVTVGKTVKVKLKNNKKKVKWKVIKGNKIIKITKKSKTYASVKGLKKGKAKVQAVIGKKKYTCIVTVTAKKKAQPAKKPSAPSAPSAPSTPPSAETAEVEKYSYEVIPLMAPFNYYFYVKTDNPDPGSFRFADKETRYAAGGKTGSITPVAAAYADVKYENSKTKRVKGGYIAAGDATDGGELRLQQKKGYTYKDTAVTVQVDGLKDVADYLISTYGDSQKTYFDNLTGIQEGFKSECLYEGAYVLGEQKKYDAAPYYGLSTSPHVDQTFYIQSPYYREDNKSMFVSAIYPMKYDSSGFPSVMGAVARRLDSTVTVKKNAYKHELIDVTYNGETKTYGGAGEGRGQGINASQIKYWYSFDGSGEDAYRMCNLADVSAMIREYGAMNVPEESTDQQELTWASVRNTVGTSGSYVKLALAGADTDGYTFMYDEGSTDEGGAGHGAVGYFTNTWYDGRYFNKYEYYVPGARFEDTVKTESPYIVKKNVTIKLPDDGKDYWYEGKPMNEVSRYNAETGEWSGFMWYNYNSKSQTWKAEICSSRIYYIENNERRYIDDQDFIDACTITMDEAKGMSLDANTDKEPESYYIYNRVTQPGTYYRGN